MSNHSLPGQDSDDSLAVAPAKPEYRRPSLWQVVMLNDDFTPMDFVIMVLVEVYDLDVAKAVAYMLEVHEKGRSIVGTYPKEIADLKVSDTHALAEQYGHPLKVVLERVSP